jgi:Ca-activated chloride channel family protein
MAPYALIASAVVVTALAAGHAGQQPAPPLFAARTELVVVHVTVKDPQGSYVADLPPEAFTVLEDGHPQYVQFFGRQDAPVDIGLIVDSSGSMLPNRERVIAAAGAFVDTSNPADRIFALAFNEHVRAALSPEAPFTSDGDVLRAALNRTIAGRGRTALYDAIAAGLQYVRRGSQPRKALVVVSDGGDNASATTFEEVLRRTQTSNTVIYTIALIDPVDREANPGRLRQLAEASGGDAYRPRDAAGVAEALQRIAHDIRSAYTLGYIPASGDEDGTFRRIRVVVNAAGLRKPSVRSRQGYLVGGEVTGP